LTFAGESAGPRPDHRATLQLRWSKAAAMRYRLRAGWRLEAFGPAETQLALRCWPSVPCKANRKPMLQKILREVASYSFLYESPVLLPKFIIAKIENA